MMDKQLREFFYDQQDRGHLAFEDSPEYAGLLRQCMALFPSGDLPEPIFDLLETANQAGAGAARVGGPAGSEGGHGKPCPYAKSSVPRSSSARRDISAFLFRLPFTR